MSRIELEQISENEIEVILPPETPLEMVQQLTKGLAARGLVEDLVKGTVAVRYFYRPVDKANDIADKLIKSLQGLTKNDELPYWHPKSQFAQQRKNREIDIGERRAKLGIKQPTNVSPAPEPHTTPDKSSIKPPTPPTSPGASTLPGVANKLYNPTTSGTVSYKKSEDNDEHVEGCRCEACLDMAKSGTGPKGSAAGAQYDPNVNARRKTTNVGDVAGKGPNRNVKAISSKPGQMSGKAQANLTARLQNAANKKQPVNSWSPEQIAAENAKRGLKKSWGQHLPFPHAEEEMARHAHRAPQTADELMAGQLYNLLAGKAMLGQSPLPQPTDEQMFGGGVVTEEMAKAAEHKWGNTFNSFMTEVQKPISQNFASEAEEMAYWNSLKISDRDDGQSGF
jgi:hypothetical protein